MLIDWFTVGAQILNFLILVWLMKRFLYKPILHAIDEREKRIAAELASAEKKKEEAKKEQEQFQRKNDEIDKQRVALLAKATAEAKAERQRLVDADRKAAEAFSLKRQEIIKKEQQNLYQAISRRTQEEVFSIARKTLSDLASVSLESRMSEVFTRRLREMDGTLKEGLAQDLKSAGNSVVVRSAFDLPADQRATIQNTLNETFTAEVHVGFETAPEIVSGIELNANGQKLAWSIADYLTSLERGVEALLKEENEPAVKPKLENAKVDTKTP